MFFAKFTTEFTRIIETCSEFAFFMCASVSSHKRRHVGMCMCFAENSRSVPVGCMICAVFEFAFSVDRVHHVYICVFFAVHTTNRSGVIKAWKTRASISFAFFVGNILHSRLLVFAAVLRVGTSRNIKGCPNYASIMIASYWHYVWFVCGGTLSVLAHYFHICLAMSQKRDRRTCHPLRKKAKNVHIVSIANCAD